MLAEDNELNREIAMELLGTVTGAAIDEAENGFEATRKIRAMERPDAASIPIFAMTANAFAGDQEKSRQAGMNAHLSRSLEISSVLAAMNEILNQD